MKILEQPELPVNEVSSDDETVNQNEQDLNQQEEVETGSIE